MSTILLVLSTGLAAAATYYAYRAVTDGRAFHRDQERDADRSRLLAIAAVLAELESVADSVSTGAEALRGALRACLARFKIAVETTAEPIPLCRTLAAFPLGGERGLYQDGTEMHAQAVAASAELHDAIRHLV